MHRLNPRDSRRAPYVPPIPVEPYFGEITVDMPYEDKIKRTLWVPASLVSMMVGQYPHLRKEDDEMFSIGVEIVCDTMADEKYNDRYEIITGIVAVRAQKAVETYANGLFSVVKVSTTTRYQNRARGIRTPRCKNVSRVMNIQYDDMTEMQIKDAMEALGYEGIYSPSQGRVVYNRLLEV